MTNTELKKYLVSKKEEIEVVILASPPQEAIGIFRNLDTNLLKYAQKCNFNIEAVELIKEEYNK